MTNQEILDNAPEGATHVDEENDYFAFNARWRWNLWHDETKRFEATRATPTRSLADIKRIVGLTLLKDSMFELAKNHGCDSVTQLAAECTRKDKRIAEFEAEYKELRLATLKAIQCMSGGQCKADLRDAYDKGGDL